jgi:hypothetical protein
MFITLVPRIVSSFLCCCIESLRLCMSCAACVIALLNFLIPIQNNPEVVEKVRAILACLGCVELSDYVGVRCLALHALHAWAPSVQFSVLSFCHTKESF